MMSREVMMRYVKKKMVHKITKVKYDGSDTLTIESPKGIRGAKHKPYLITPQDQSDRRREAMPNPHGRCKICKERHAPGNCRGGVELFGGSLPAKNYVAAVGNLAVAVNDLVNYIDGSKESWTLHLGGGTVGGVLVKKVRRALMDAGFRTIRK